MEGDKEENEVKYVGEKERKGCEIYMPLHLNNTRSPMAWHMKSHLLDRIPASVGET